MVTVVVALVLAAPSGHSLRRARLGIVGGLALIVLDVAMLAAALLVAPAPAWPMVAAIPAGGLARIGRPYGPPLPMATRTCLRRGQQRRRAAGRPAARRS